MKIVEKVKQEFCQRFQADPLLVKAPGRINLIGEHTDYNEGFVLPAAVNQSIYFAIGKSEDENCRIVALDFEEEYEFRFEGMKPLAIGSWQNYVMGVVAEILKSDYKLSGFNLVFSGDVPKGSGMSSSAALECGTCLALNALFDLNIPRIEMVKMAQKAEHNYAQVMCGIMDQFASMMGKEDHALKLDCRTLDFDYFPVNLNGYALLLCNSNVSHSLADSEYNVRRNQCDEGVAVLKTVDPKVNSLRDVTLETLEQGKSELSEVVYRRCKYVVEENQRVAAFSLAVSEGDLAKAGDILKTAQDAMRYEYEVTCPEIDFMADFANSYPGVLGARMMGGGFGGCTLNLIEKEKEDAFLEALSDAYKKEFEKEMTPIEVAIDEGVQVIS